MNKTSVVRLYKFSDAKLVAKGKEKIAFMRRDLAAFAPFGITAVSLTTLESAINVFSNTITDIESLSEQMEATVNKDAKADELCVAIRTVMACAKLQYSTDSPRYKKFGTDTLSRQRDADLFITGKRVALVGIEFLATYPEHGLTANMLDAITRLCEEFQELIIDLKIKKGERNITKDHRVEAGNSIYQTLVKYNTMGLSIWETSNVAKSNDYVIYN
ncbi:hypothetical protein [Flavobacterium sp. 5]|uniref:hypothetical protein n=1 Tax=Flavobacterium sp. 5 TaxID=2035199 RepID=UPI000C2CD8BD|nr:hypothetical protein [Flavobacterium sp. 5]PKB17239.1 hypothetical protein CLU82_2425 [Flavobacterium sp. 5]